MLEDAAGRICFADLDKNVHVVVVGCGHAEDCAGAAEDCGFAGKGVSEGWFIGVLIHLLGWRVCLV